MTFTPTKAVVCESTGAASADDAIAVKRSNRKAIFFI
jgi:hypothetical protein